MSVTKNIVSCNDSSILKKTQPEKNLDSNKKNISLIFFFISHLFLNNKKNFQKFNQLKGKQFHLVHKRKVWKFLVNFFWIKKNNCQKILELVLIGKRLNIKKNLAKILSIFISKKFFLNFSWNIASYMDNRKKNRNFSQDILILNGFIKNTSFSFFCRNYFKIKLKSFEESLFFQSKLKLSRIFNFLKIRFLINLLVVICFTFIKNDSVTSLNIVFIIVGKKLWLISHLINFLKEIFNMIRSTFLGSTKVFTILCTIMAPYFPILSSFWTFSILKEYHSFCSSFLRSLVINLKLKKSMLFVKKIVFPSKSTSGSETYFYLPLKNFYLYR